MHRGIGQNVHLDITCLGIIEDGALEFQDLCEEYIEEFPELLKASKPQLRQVLNDLREYLDTIYED